jgi:hypothetical protein
MAIFASAMVVGLTAGVYAGLGIHATNALDRSAELWFAVTMWTVAVVGSLLGGDLGLGMVLGGLVLLVLWSFLHFPKVKTIETPVPHRTPLLLLMFCLVTLVLLGIAIALG